MASSRSRKWARMPTRRGHSMTTMILPSKPTPARVGGRLLRAREARGWTLRHCARACGLSAGHLSKLERGLIARPSHEVYDRLARCFGLRLDELLEDE